MAAKREVLIELIRRLTLKLPEEPIPIPEGLKGFATVDFTQFRCIACKKCEEVCAEKALTFKREFDLPAVFEATLPETPEAKNRLILAKFIKRLATKRPERSVPVPEGLRGFGLIEFDPSKCVACGDCKEVCPEVALELTPKFDLPRILSGKEGRGG